MSHDGEQAATSLFSKEKALVVLMRDSRAGDGKRGCGILIAGLKTGREKPRWKEDEKEDEKEENQQKGEEEPLWKMKEGGSKDHILQDHIRLLRVLGVSEGQRGPE